MIRTHIVIELTYEQEDAVHYNVLNPAGHILISSRTVGDRLPFASCQTAIVAACNTVAKAATQGG